MTDRAEIEHFAALDERPFVRRTLGYLRHMGPGYMQSAMTLGGGTAFASIFAGAAFGYQLLWVAPVAMLLGIIMLSAIAHQTLSTGENPFQAMKRHAGPVFAYGWAFSGILSSIIWQFAQYALASSMMVAIVRQYGIEAPNWAMGLVALAWCVTVALLYESKPRAIRLYENIIKGMVWFIIACFGFVVFRTGIPQPAELLAGAVPFRIPGENQGVEGMTLVVSGLAAAVGANMVFVYPYTLRRRGWGRAHRRLARIDLGFGMFVPYAIAASLMLIASASVFYYGDPELFTGKKIAPWVAAEVLSSPERLGPVAGMWIFGLGVVAMALSSITMQMMCSGFALSELCGAPAEGRVYRIGMLLPAVGVLGSVFWSDISLWLAVPTNVICGFLLPLAYVGFLILQHKRAYLGDDLPRGPLGRLWTVGMLCSTGVVTAFLIWFSINNLPSWFEKVG
ncbi:MAG: Nramp family divalent metal transporter [Planctomycetota bacterium]|nr:Nramp family divalent metal transporter [Planctomycetota bacterium]MDP6762297.1 Nramp family divalent metal transporter [Planctomycetota bacterium]MDP6990315.1 Nramp family divalent metal transporter [Planctomycetota bacterium]